MTQTSQTNCLEYTWTLVQTLEICLCYLNRCCVCGWSILHLYNGIIFYARIVSGTWTCTQDKAQTNLRDYCGRSRQCCSSPADKFSQTHTHPQHMLCSLKVTLNSCNLKTMWMLFTNYTVLLLSGPMALEPCANSICSVICVYHLKVEIKPALHSTAHRMLMIKNDSDLHHALGPLYIQDRQCMYNNTVVYSHIRGHGKASIKYCVCSCSYPAYYVHVPYCIVICGLSGCTTFFHIIS
jgi:hypothetical protein